MPTRFRDRAPHVVRHEPSGTLRWRIGDRWCSLVGNYSVAGWTRIPAVVPADARRRRSRLLRRHGPRRAHGLGRRLRAGAVPQHRRLRRARIPRPRRPRPAAGVRADLQRLPVRVRIGCARALRAARDAAVLGPRRVARGAAPVSCDGPPRRAVGGHARQARLSRVLRPALGSAVRGRRRTSSCRSTSTSASATPRKRSSKR